MLNSKRISWLLSSLLVRDEIREKVGRIRYAFLKRRLQTVDPLDSCLISNTVSYNLKALSRISTDFHMRRMKWLVYGTIANELVSPSSKILMIGPRTENEILLLKGLGYNNVTGLDLISYSPWIKLGDMHALPFDANSFDAIVCGWTLSYSKKPARAAEEMTRVLRSGGVVGVGVEHAYLDAPTPPPCPGDIDGKEALTNRINTSQEILAIFQAHAQVTPILQYDAFLRDLPIHEIKRLTGLSSSQVLFVAQISK
jgi:SAM-dependent methyltransferase